MRSSIWLKLFDRERDFVANKVMTVGGQALVPGDPFDKTLVNTRRLRQMYEARKVRMVEKTEGEEEPADIIVTSDDIPEAWRDLPWIPEEKGGPTIRQLAAKFTTGTIKNVDGAIAIIEAELARREATANSPPAEEPADEPPPAAEPDPAVDPEPVAEPAPEPETAPAEGGDEMAELPPETAEIQPVQADDEPA